MSGKTIDGVPRELLEGLRDSASEEAEQYRQGMGSIRPHRQASLDKVVADCDALLAAPVVERQPVAYADPKAFENFKNHAHKGGLWDHEWMWANPDSRMVPLYTSPPAPVAVTLPPAQDVDDMWHSVMKDRAIGWNACLDKVKELNQ